jgi:hypothetical protein
VDECDAEPGAGVLEGVGTECRAVVDIEAPREAAFLEGADEAVTVAVEALGEVEAGVGDEPGMVVDHGEEVDLPELAFVRDAGAMHAVGLPEVVGKLGFETPAVFGKPRVLFDAFALEEPVEAVLGRRPGGIDDPPCAGDLHEDRQADAEVLLAQGNEGGLQFLIERPAFIPVLARLGLEGFQPITGSLVQREPTEHRRAGDG